MRDFILHIPTHIYFGRGYCDTSGSALSEAGFARALVVSGRGSAIQNGTLGRVLASLDAAGIAHRELSGVRANPELTFIRRGITAARDFQADVILGVGGGSVIDTAKAISWGVPYPGDVWDIFDAKAQPVVEGKPGVACVLTIAAAGSEASNSAVVSNDELKLKKGYLSDLNRPAVAIMDPELTFSVPPYHFAAGVCDMCCHLMERYFGATEPLAVTDNISCGIIRAIMRAGSAALEDPTNYDARAEIMWAGLLAHSGLTNAGRAVNPRGNAGGWESHGLEHELSGHDPNISHGAALAVIFPAWMRYVWQEHPERFLSFGRDVFGIEPVDPLADGVDISPEEALKDAVLATIDALQEFFVSLGLPQNLRDLGVTEEMIPELLVTLEHNKGSVFGEFKRLSMEDAAAIYRLAL